MIAIIPNRTWHAATALVVILSVGTQLVLAIAIADVPSTTRRGRSRPS